MRKTYLVEESVSGETRKVRAESPVAAIRAYLKDEVEVNEHNKQWRWEFEVTRLTRGVK